MSHLVNKPYASKSKYFLLLSQSGHISKRVLRSAFQSEALRYVSLVLHSLKYRRTQSLEQSY